MQDETESYSQRYGFPLKSVGFPLIPPSSFCICFTSAIGLPTIWSWFRPGDAGGIGLHSVHGFCSPLWQEFMFLNKYISSGKKKFLMGSFFHNGSLDSIIINLLQWSASVWLKKDQMPATFSDYGINWRSLASLWK